MLLAFCPMALIETTLTTLMDATNLSERDRQRIITRCAVRQQTSPDLTDSALLLMERHGESRARIKVGSHLLALDYVRMV